MVPKEGWDGYPERVRETKNKKREVGKIKHIGTRRTKLILNNFYGKSIYEKLCLWTTIKVLIIGSIYRKDLDQRTNRTSFHRELPILNFR